MEFSLCAIYKNEEKNLETFIRNHRHLVEQMILVDTGSTDRSSEIVKDNGLEHYFFKWTHHFSDARNFSLKQAVKPWIVVLDMDEQILEKDFIRLKELMEHTGKDAYSLVQINFTDAVEDMNWQSITALPQQFHSYASGFIPSPLIRVFRNLPEITFHGAIHELVGESLKRSNLSSMKTNIPIYHMGWTSSARTEEEKKQKKKSYRELIEREWQHDQSPKMAFYYLSTMEDPEERLRLGFKLTRQYPEIKQFWEVVARTAAELEQYARAISYADKGLHRHPGHTPLIALKATCLNSAGRPDQALELLNRLLEKDREHPVYWLEKFKALAMLGRKEDAAALSSHLPQQFPPELANQLIAMIKS